jgi:hypothetical protein
MVLDDKLGACLLIGHNGVAVVYPWHAHPCCPTMNTRLMPLDGGHSRHSFGYFLDNGVNYAIIFTVKMLSADAALFITCSAYPFWGHTLSQTRYFSPFLYPTFFQQHLCNLKFIHANAVNGKRSPVLATVLNLACDHDNACCNRTRHAALAV